jgi:hypothetical protein
VNTIKLRNSAGATDFTLAGVAYFPNDKGEWEVPADAAQSITGLPAGFFIVEDAEPSAPPPSNTYSVGVETVTVDMESLDMRIRLLELESFCRIHSIAYAKFSDSTGAQFTFGAAEASHLVASVRQRMNATI